MAIKRIINLRSTIAHSASEYYASGLKSLEAEGAVEVVEVLFDPHAKEQPTETELPEADLILLVDCGLPVEFPFFKGRKIPMAYVSIDSCHKLDIHKAYCEKFGFDYIWVAQKHVVGKLGPKARWLPLAADPATHVWTPEMEAAKKPTGLLGRFSKRRHYDIGMCGAPYKHRKEFEKLFKRAGLSTDFYYRKRFGADVTREVARCTIGFNLGAGFTGVKGQDLNMRVFETMANGRCMLLTNVYDSLGYEELFTDNLHYVTYRTADEALKKARYYKENPEAARKIAEEGQRHILAHHTYAHRAKEIVDAIG
ncbi:MAG: glycosyltransferase family 1 protein [Proteobacteria bacterium]|nr:glycosyltransferase family 1 protein [Pseudomonadota bacterium]